MQTDNNPQWDLSLNKFYEVWYLKFNLTTGPEAPALWLRFTTLSLADGSKKIAEVWAIFSESPLIAKAPQKIAIKNTFSHSEFTQLPQQGLKIYQTIFTENHTQGSVTQGSHSIQWDLHFTPNDYTFHHVPRILKTLKLAKSTVCKPNMNIHFTGSFTVNGRQYRCEEAPGCQGHIWGSKYAQRWAWAHCNFFNQSTHSPAVFEVLTAQVTLAGILPSPPMTAFFLEYQQKRYLLNTLIQALTTKSSYDLTQWDIQAALTPELTALIHIHTTPQALVCVTYEDTNGQRLYCHNTNLASSTLTIFRKGNREAEFTSHHTTAFETVERRHDPQVELLL